MSIRGLIKRIEELRLELVRIKLGRAYTDPEVVFASQKLDEVLDEYQELVKLNESDYTDEFTVFKKKRMRCSQ